MNSSQLTIEQIRNDFPILSRQVRGKPLVYLDNAATTQTPLVVSNRLYSYQTEEHSNIHRGIHFLSQQATESYESARQVISEFINAHSSKEIIYVRNTTEAINLVAYSFLAPILKAGDEVIITHMEHHSNIVPWQKICNQYGAILKVASITKTGKLDKENFISLFSPKTRLCAIAHVSNALGTINPVKELVALSHDHGVPVLLDGAQAVGRMVVDVQDLDCDFYAFSGHKMYGPTGIGVLYGKEAILNSMEPFQCGGDMIIDVTFEKTLYNEIPHKFEAGTPHIAGAIGLSTAIGYLKNIGMEKIQMHETELTSYATEELLGIDDLKILGTTSKKAGVISFTLGNAHPHDVAHELDLQGIAIRAGHHCAQPVLKYFGLNATNRVSFGLYNTMEEVDFLITHLPSIREKFSK